MRTLKVLVLSLAVLSICAHAGAQGLYARFPAAAPSRAIATESLPIAPEWGTSATSYLAVGPWAWQPGGSDTTFDWTNATGLKLFRTGGTTIFLVAPFSLPSGALITGVRFEACDSNAAAQAHFFIEDIPVAGGFNQIDVGGTGVSFAGGCQEFVFTVGPITVNNATDSYVLLTDMQAADDTITLGSARIAYKLQISPDPATATFADVPVGSLYHRFVEALVAAGITFGCGGTPPNYCPDQPVTRGQMAVFLSAALGLHWAP